MDKQKEEEKEGSKLRKENERFQFGQKYGGILSLSYS